MKTKPILFSTPMVEAIFNGRKTQTRRTQGLEEVNKNPDDWKFLYFDNGVAAFINNDNHSVNVKIKFPEDIILWVRETWRVNAWDDICEMLVQYKDGTKNWCQMYDPNENGDWICNYAENLLQKGIFQINDEEEKYELADGKTIPWKPSIFMPREACRLFLECTNVRIERLQDISENDAIAEGIEFNTQSIADTGDYISYPRNYLETTKSADGWPYFKEEEFVKSFQSLWQSINGKESWNDNPFVFVYDFKQVERPKNFI
jgi:hypothetical protein